MRVKGSKSQTRSSEKKEEIEISEEKAADAVEDFVEELEDENDEFDDEDDGDVGKHEGDDEEEFDDGYEMDDFEREELELEAEREKEAKRKAEKKQIRRDNKTINYVDGDKLLERIREYYKTDSMSPELAIDIMKICERLSSSAKFCGYTYRDEMVEDAFLHCYNAIYNKKYNPDLGYNPFSYITMIAFHSFQAKIKLEKKEREKCDNYREEHYDLFKDASIEDAVESQNECDD